METILGGGWPKHTEPTDLTPVDQLVFEISKAPRHPFIAFVGILGGRAIEKFMQNPGENAIHPQRRSQFRNALYLLKKVQPSPATLVLLRDQHTELFINGAANGHTDYFEPDLRRQMIAVLDTHARQIPAAA